MGRRHSGITTNRDPTTVGIGVSRLSIVHSHSRRWIKHTGLGAPELEHLKRIRRQGEKATLLLCTSSSPPELPLEVELPAPYLLRVPRSAALTPNSLLLKTSIWPTLFTPCRKVEPDRWSRGQVAWAREAIQTLIQGASVAVAQREVVSRSLYLYPYRVLIHCC
jgi:tRNA-specific adenosine deaminase 3